MPGDPKVIARFETVGEAEVARSALDAASIESEIYDENMARLAWIYAHAMGGIG